MAKNTLEQNARTLTSCRKAQVDIMVDIRATVVNGESADHNTLRWVADAVQRYANLEVCIVQLNATMTEQLKSYSSFH